MLKDLEQLTVGEVIASCAAIGTVTTALIVLIKRVTKTWREHLKPTYDALQKALILLNGRDAVTLPENPSVELTPAIPGALQRIESIEQTTDKMVVQQAMQKAKTDLIHEDMQAVKAQVSTVEHEMQHNGGGSIKDAVRRIELNQKEQAKQQEVQNRVLGYIGEQLDKGAERFEHGTKRFERIEDHLGIEHLEGDPGELE